MPEFWTPKGTYQMGETPQEQLSRVGKLIHSSIIGEEPEPGEDEATQRRRSRWSAAAQIANDKLERTGSAQPSNPARGSLTISTDRPRDPFWYWEQNQMPFEHRTVEGLSKMREYARRLYLSHPVAGGAVDIYSRFPLTGMEFDCKDPGLIDFYSDLFFDDLNYEDFLVDVGREYWTVAEAWPLGSFNEILGVWEADELVDPDDVRVTPTPFFSEPRLEMMVPKEIRDIVQNQEPQWEYEQLLAAYPQFVELALLGESDQAWMPVSNMLLGQVAYRPDPFSPRGIPLLMRGFRYYLQEEMLNSAIDSVAYRLYMPLLLVKLGASAQDLGTDTPWVPTQGDLANLEELIDTALAADLRALVHHFAIDITHVLGREIVPNLSSDFDRLTEKQLQGFGLSKTLLSGAEGGSTYAADAINRDLVTQLLMSFQRIITRFTHQRAAVVAEAQGHYDYDLKGGKRMIKYEQVLVRNDDGTTGVEERPKLLVPKLRIRSMNLRDEKTYRQFLEGLVDKGVPISEQTRLQNLPIDLETERDRMIEEAVEKAVAQQRTRWQTYQKMKTEGLPVPKDLEDDFGKLDPSGVPAQTTTSDEPTDYGIPPMLGDDIVKGPLSPPEDAQNGQGQPGPGGKGGNPFAPGGGNSVDMMPRNRARPPESDEMRADMPKAAHLALRNVDGERITMAEDEVYDEGESRVVVAATESVGRDPGLSDDPAHPWGGIGLPPYIGSRRAESNGEARDYREDVQTERGETDEPVG